MILKKKIKLMNRDGIDDGSEDKKAKGTKSIS